MTINLRQVIDTAPISRSQWTIAVLLTIVLVLEGIDFQSAAYSAPVLMKLWHLGKLQFTPLVAAAPIGMAVGALIGSWAGDRIGRKPTVVAGVVFFGAMTLVCASAATPREFMLYRFVSGLGFGAVLPVAIALMGEWMPRRVVAKAVSIMTIGIPGGIIVGALIAAAILPHYGWRVFFLTVGGLCVTFAVVLGIFVSESPSFLVLRGQHDRVHRLLAQAWSRAIGGGNEAFDLDEVKVGGESLAAGYYRRTNLGLWLAALAGSLATYAMGAWLTVVLIGFRLPLTSALRGPVTYSSAAIAGTLAVGWLISRFGSRPAMLALAALGAIASAAVSMGIATLPIGGSLLSVLFAGLVVIGISIGSLLSATYVLATATYTAAIRARGVGVMAAIGRVGSILGSLLGGAVLATAPASIFFAGIAALIAVMAVGTAIIDRHQIPLV